MENCGKRIGFGLLLSVWIGSSALGQTVQTPPALPKPLHTVSVRGTAHQEVEPEKADLLLTYRYSDNVKDSDRTRDQENNLQEVLRKAGIPPEKLVLDELSANGYGGLSKTGNATVALTKVYRLTLTNPKLLNSLIPQLVKTGADNLRVVNQESSRLAAVRLEVAGQAAANARQKAELAVKLAGGQLGTPITVVEVLPGASPADPRLAYRLSGYDKAKSAGLEEETGEISTPNLRKIKVEAVYDVVFEIK